MLKYFGYRHKKYDYLSRATSFTPPSCKIGTDEANKAIGTTVYKQNISKAQQLWKEGLNELGASQASFNVIATEEYKDTVKELVQGIQAGVGSISAYGNDDEHKISFSLKVNILSESDYQMLYQKVIMTLRFINSRLLIKVRLIFKYNH